jgi:heme/copper-type cytochrome/quinol oxidase subunit 2
MVRPLARNLLKLVEVPMRAYASRLTRRRWVVLGLTAAVGGLVFRSSAKDQEQAFTRRDVSVTVKGFRFSPARIAVSRDDLVRVTVQSEDVAYSFTIDAYWLSKRVPAGGSVSFEFLADREGAFPFYSSLTNDPRHAEARGELVVGPR